MLSVKLPSKMARSIKLQFITWFDKYIKNFKKAFRHMKLYIKIYRVIDFN